MMAKKHTEAPGASETVEARDRMNEASEVTQQAHSYPHQFAGLSAYYSGLGHGLAGHDWHDHPMAKPIKTAGHHEEHAEAAHLGWMDGHALHEHPEISHLLKAHAHETHEVRKHFQDAIGPVVRRDRLHATH